MYHPDLWINHTLGFKTPLNQWLGLYNHHCFTRIAIIQFRSWPFFHGNRQGTLTHMDRTSALSGPRHVLLAFGLVEGNLRFQRPGNPFSRKIKSFSGLALCPFKKKNKNTWAMGGPRLNMSGQKPERSLSIHGRAVARGPTACQPTNRPTDQPTN